MPTDAHTLPTIVFLHGFAESREVWTDFTRSFPAGYRLLFQYAIGFSPSASHFPAMQRIVVSPERGVISMQWYEYQCWKGKCDDWVVQYAR